MEIFIENLLDITQSSAKIDKVGDFVSMLHHRTGCVNENFNLGQMAGKLICVLQEMFLKYSNKLAT